MPRGELGLDGAKMLLRASLNYAETLPTLCATAEAVNALTDAGVPTFLAPLPVIREDGAFKVQKRADLLASLVGVAAALGGSSHHTWLKLAYCEDFAVVAGASSLPILMLGGASLENRAPLLKEFATGMAGRQRARRHGGAQCPLQAMSTRNSSGGRSAASCTGACTAASSASSVSAASPTSAWSAGRSLLMSAGSSVAWMMSLPGGIATP
jgi:hypothetical protein